MAYGGLQSLLADTEPVAFGANPWRRLLLEEEGSLKPYGEGGGHHVPAKAGFRNAPNYDPDTALAIPDAELNALGLNHPVITGQQQVLYRAFAQTGQPLTWGAVQSIETQALVNAGASPQWAAETVAEAIQDLIANGVSGPTRIPWGG
jgi:hypothetical protein